MGLGGVLDGLWMDIGQRDHFGSLLGTILEASWGSFWRLLEDSWGAYWDYFGIFFGCRCRNTSLYAWNVDFDGFRDLLERQK